MTRHNIEGHFHWIPNQENTANWAKMNLDGAFYFLFKTNKVKYNQEVKLIEILHPSSKNEI